MITLLGWLFSSLLILILLPVLVLFVQVLMACLPARSRASAQGSRPRVAVLIPAHNESSIIVATLNSIRPQLLLGCLLYTSPSPRDRTRSRMPSSA